MKQLKLETKNGSATSPRPSKKRGIIIAHIANSRGKWGKGFVLAINKLSLAAKAAYQAYARDCSNNIPLGHTQFVEVQPNLFVANMIAQNGVDKSIADDGCLVDYDALTKCISLVFDRASSLRCNVHIPAGIGSGLAGGDREKIHEIIKSAAKFEGIAHGSSNPVSLGVTLWEFDNTSADSYIKTQNLDDSDVDLSDILDGGGTFRDLDL